MGGTIVKIYKYILILRLQTKLEEKIQILSMFSKYSKGSQFVIQTRGLTPKKVIIPNRMNLIFEDWFADRI